MSRRPLVTAFAAIVLTVGSTTFGQEPPKTNQPTRPGVARPAEIARAGVLQVEVGVDSRYDAEAFDLEQTLPTFFRYSATHRLALDFGFDGFVSRVPPDTRSRTTGFGDSTMGAQWVALSQSHTWPAVGLAYVAKLPTAPAQLGSGEVDHRVQLLVSKNIGQVDVSGVATYLNVGHEGAGRTSGGSFAVSASQDFESNFGYLADVSHQTVDAEVPEGTFALGAVTYKLSDAAQLDAGIRVGLSSGAPTFSVVGGIAVGIPVARR